MRKLDKGDVLGIALVVVALVLAVRQAKSEAVPAIVPLTPSAGALFYTNSPDHARA